MSNSDLVTKTPAPIETISSAPETDPVRQREAAFKALAEARKQSAMAAEILVEKSLTTAVAAGRSDLARHGNILSVEHELRHAELALHIALDELNDAMRAIGIAPKYSTTKTLD